VRRSDATAKVQRERGVRGHTGESCLPDLLPRLEHILDRAASHGTWEEAFN
jgi:hypothetical protein